MDQLNLFPEEEVMEIIIPRDVLSPLESNKSVKSKAFREVQSQWANYVKAVQNHHKCSWFEARKLVIDHRDKQEPIEIGTASRIKLSLEVR